MAKINEKTLRKIIAESVKSVLKEGITTVTDPIGYHFARASELQNILDNGFDPAFISGSGGAVLGPGFYFFTEPDTNMMRYYGRAIIKVKVKGTFKAINNYNLDLDVQTVFVVPPQEAGNIQIIDYKVL